MKRFSGIMIGALAMIIIIGIAPSAHALQMRMSNDNGATWGVVISDNQAIDTTTGIGDYSPTAGLLTYTGAFGNFDLTVNAAYTKPAYGTAGNPMMHITSSYQSSGAGSLLLQFTDTNYGPVSSTMGGMVTTLAANTDAAMGVQNYLDDSNNPYGTSGPAVTNLASFMIPAATNNHYSHSTAVAPDGNFSLTSTIYVDATGQGQAGSIDMKLAPVPEPSTFVLMGMGFVGAAILRKRFRTRA